MSAPYLFAVMGPTASGKSQLAETIAEAYNATILNADAFQVYRGMDIGTAKPADRSRYELLDLKNPDEDFGVGEFVLLASELLHELYRKGRNAVVCGGTGLYVRALLEEYKDLMPAPPIGLRESLRALSLADAVEQLRELAPNEAMQTDLMNEVRVKRALEKAMTNDQPISFSVPPFQIKKLAIVPPTEISHQKIKQRTKEMFQNGWVAEVQSLLNRGYGPGNPGFRALGYEAIAKYLQEDGNQEELCQEIELVTVKYAKRQRTWLRAEPNLMVFSEISEALGAIERPPRSN